MNSQAIGTPPDSFPKASPPSIDRSATQAQLVAQAPSVSPTMAIHLFPWPPEGHPTPFPWPPEGHPTPFP